MTQPTHKLHLLFKRVIDRLIQTHPEKKYKVRLGEHPLWGSFERTEEVFLEKEANWLRLGWGRIDRCGRSYFQNLSGHYMEEHLDFSGALEGRTGTTGEDCSAGP